MKTSVVTSALHVLGGLIGGAVVSTVLTHSIAARRPAAPAEAAPAHEIPARLAGGDQNAWLEWRLRRLEDGAAAAAAAAETNRPAVGGDGDPAHPPRTYSQADLLVEQQRHVREYDEAIRAHDREPRDAPWADSTARSLSTEMASLSAAGHFSVTGVDCKTTSCKAGFRWPSYAAATETSSQLLNHMYEANCTHTILLPPPPDPTAPYDATMLFDCEEQRADQRL